MNMKNLAIIVLAAFVLTSCGGGGGNSGPTVGGGGASPSQVTTTQAEAAAQNNIATSVNSNIGALGSLASNSSAIQTLMQTIGLDLTQPPPMITAVQDDPASALEKQVEDALAVLFENGVRSGDKVTYDPDENVLCADALIGTFPALADTVGQNVAVGECVDFYSHVTIVLTIISDTSGRIDFKYDDYILLTVGYDANSSYTEFDLAQLKLIVEAIGQQQVPPEDPGLPATFEGVVRITMTELGPDHGRITLSIEQDVNIIDNSQAITTSIFIAATPKVIELIADGVKQTASFEIALGAVNALFPVEDSSLIEQQAELDLSALTLLASLQGNGDELVITNIGIGNSPFTLNVVDLSDVLGIDPVDLTLDLSTFDMSVNGTNSTITFDTLFTLLLKVDDRFGIFGGFFDTGVENRLDIEIAQGTELGVKENSQAIPVLEVNNGSVIVQGTGSYVGSSTFLTGTCMTPNLDTTQAGLPLLPASCL